MKVIAKLVFFLCLISTCVACNSAGEKSKDQLLMINVAHAKSQDAGARKEFSFIAQPYRTSELSFRVGGPIDRFDVYAGNHYKRGEVIAEIDSRDFRIRKERAEAVYAQAKAEEERIRVLYEKNNISASAYEKAKADYTTAKTAFQTATNELNDTKLIAPFDGYVGEVYIEKYQDVKPTQPVISFVDINKLKIEAYVTQDIAYNSQDLKDVNLHFDAMPNDVYSAKVVEVSKSTTKNNLSYLLTAFLPNSGGEILAGMSGKVFFETTNKSTAQPIMTIPQKAICHRPTEGDYVWIVNSDTKQVTMRKVTLGTLQRDGQVSISDGIAEGEAVALNSLRFLSDGMQIEIAQ